MLFNIRRFNVIAEWAQRYEEGGIEALVDRRRKQCLKKMTQDKVRTGIPSMGDDTLTREQLLTELNRLRTENAYLKKLDALVLANTQSALHKKRK